MLTAIFALALAAAAGSNPLGVWLTPVDQGHIQIERCGADICGRAVDSARMRDFPDQKDARNKDAALRSRTIKGLVIMRLHPQADGRWGDGWIYNPKDGGTYKADLQVVGGGTRLRLRGCVVAPFCQTQTWKRVE